jgi:hypothetical protein
MTNNNDNIVENDRVALEDTAGRAEIQEIIQEIERLKAGGAPTVPETKEESAPEEKNEELEASSEDEEASEQEETEEDEEDEEEQEALAPQEKPKKLDKIWKIKKGYYKEKAVNKALLEENGRLKEMVSQLETAGTYQYGRNIYTELERAKEQLQKAVDENNPKAFIEATANLTNAQYKVNDLERLAAQIPISVPTPQIEQSYSVNQDYDSEIFNEAVTEFLGSHKELQQGSKFFNKALAESVVKYSKELDRQRSKAGLEDIYYTDDPEAIQDYIDLIEDHMAEYNSKIAKNKKTIEAASHVGGVRNSYSGSAPGKSPQPIKVTLTPDEKKMCANSFGRITEEAWLKFKAEEQQKAGKSL